MPRAALLWLGNINCHLRNPLLKTPLKCVYCVPCRFGRFMRPGAGRIAYHEKQKNAAGIRSAAERGKAGHKKAARNDPGGAKLFFCTGDQN